MVAKIQVIVMVVIAIAAVGGAAALYLMPRGSSEAYELSYNFQAGASYTNKTTLTMSFLGKSQEISSSETMKVLEVVGNEFVIQHSYTMQVPLSGGTTQTVAASDGTTQTGTIVFKYRMTTKGARSNTEIVSVEPAELRAPMEQALGQWSYLAGVNVFPADPVRIGQEWATPLDMQFQQAGMSMTLSGSVRSTLVGLESMTVGAGTFNCWRLSRKIDMSGQMEVTGQKVTMTMSGEATSWNDDKSGAQVKTNLPLSAKVKATGMEIEIQLTATMELVDYQAP